MELKKIQKVTEKVEENVLTITEEFMGIAKDVVNKVLLSDKKHVPDPMLMLLLTASYAQLAGELDKALFKQKEETKE